MRNMYPGICYVCGKNVEPMTGHFERIRGGWRVKHAIYPGDGRVTCKEANEVKNENPKVFKSSFPVAASRV